MGQGVAEKGTSEEVRHVVGYQRIVAPFSPRATLLPGSMSCQGELRSGKTSEFSSMASTPAGTLGWVQHDWEIKSAAET